MDARTHGRRRQGVAAVQQERIGGGSGTGGGLSRLHPVGSHRIRARGPKLTDRPAQGDPGPVRGPVPGNAATQAEPDAGVSRGRPLLRPGLAFRDQIRRHPRPRPTPRRHRDSLGPQGRRRHRAISGDRSRVEQNGSGTVSHRWRDRRHGRQRPAELPATSAADAPDQSVRHRASGADGAGTRNVLRLPGGRGTGPPYAPLDATKRVSRPLSPGPGRGPILGTHSRTRRGLLSRRLGESPGGHHRQARGQPLRGRAHPGMVEVQVSAASGVRGRRIHQTRGLSAPLWSTSSRALP